MHRHARPIATSMSEPHPPAILETHALTRRFGALVAVDAIAISVPVGQMFGLLGSNGAGKTTVIKMLTTLCRRRAAPRRSLDLTSAETPRRSAAPLVRSRTCSPGRT
jgi:ABC-2 type transport system ATP-binding protein